MLLIGGCVASLPTIASLPAFKARAERSLSQALGVPVSLGSHSIGWLSGVAIDGLVVAQPPGFAADQPLLTLERARLQIGWFKALRGVFDLGGELQGVRLLVRQRADGRLNVKEIGSDDDGDVDGRSGSVEVKGDGDLKYWLERVRADFALRDVAIDVVHEEKGTLESIRRLNATIDKRFGSTDFNLTLDAELAGPDASKPPGKVQIAADVDASLQRPIDVQLTSAGFDFARYRPLVDAMLGAGSLSALDGVLDGTIKARIENLNTVFIQGALTIDHPRFAGDLLQGMNVSAPKWVINPNLKLTMDASSAVPKADLEGFSVDLGMLRLRGVPAATADAMFAGAPALAIDFDVDLQAVGKLGGPVPATLGAQPGSASGRAALQIPAGGFAIDDVLEFVTESLRVEAAVKLDRLALGSVSSLLGIDLGAKLENGTLKVGLAPGASLNGGALTLAAGVDLKQPSWPVTLDVGVQGTNLVADSLQALQYAVPLFAGLAGQAGAELGGKGTVSLALEGPGNKASADSWLAWLNHWSGGGTLALTEGAVELAPAFTALMQFADLGSQGTFAFKDLATEFRLRAGGVETALLKLDVKGKKIGISGRTMLDGSMNHKLDLTELLAGHKDGDKVLKYLAGTKIEGAITGTLVAPRLQMPDVQALLTQALKNAAQDELKKGAEDLLRKGLDELFKKKED